MSLIKSNKRRRPMWGTSLFTDDPFFSELMDTRKLNNLNRIFNGEDFDFSPAVNIKDNEKDYEIELAAPGLEKDDFKVTMENGILTISAEREEKSEEEKEGFVKKEFSYNSFSRSMSLPDSIDEEKEVKASYKDGILKMILQKKEETEASKKQKTIKVS
ncbi:MAG TPA: Hsp20/alpha crystallin family protein [Salegentibacter sp.]|uniref:Hsp20/alpha crystallin family protein n=1 Tax=Salegentibacter sp. TaxID=1903072 RepID=UPI002F95AA24